MSAAASGATASPGLRHHLTGAPEPIATPSPKAHLREQPSLREDLQELTKARLTAMVLLTTLAGYIWSSHGEFGWGRLVHTLVGTALVAICASVGNQAWERRSDARMRRTEARPLVTRRFPLGPTLALAALAGLLGCLELAVFVNGLSALLAAVTLAVYVLIYTPLKKLTTANTLVGALPGALPPLIGAAAAQGRIGAEGWMLFGILALWQLPHFYAIAWLYRDDFRAAELRMVSVRDGSGRSTGRHALIAAAALLPISLLPQWAHQAGPGYTAVAALASLWYLLRAAQFAQEPGRGSARQLFLASILYLPLLLLALAIDVPLYRAFGW